MAETNQPEGARYASIAEFVSEFGDYRVNADVTTLSDSEKAEPNTDELVTNDPYTCMATGKSE